MKQKSKTIILTSILMLMLVFMGGITYAFFTAVVGGGDKGSSVIVKTGTLTLTYVDGLDINLAGVLPGDSVSKEFRVTNTGDVVTNYRLFFSDVVNTFVVKSDLVYEISCKDINTSDPSQYVSCDGKSETTLPSLSSSIMNSSDIGIGRTHVYTIIIKFKETGINQDENQGKLFKGKITVNTKSNNTINLFGVVNDENGLPYQNKILLIEND